MGKLWEEFSKTDLIAHHNKIRWCERNRLHARFTDIKKLWINVSWITEAQYYLIFQEGNLDAKKTIEKILKKKYNIKPQDIPAKEFSVSYGMSFNLLNKIVKFYMKEKGYKHIN